MEERVKMLKEQMYARLRGEAPKVQVQQCWVIGG